MFERILLPLDGSQLAELAIPYGEELAGRLGSEIILLHACPPEHQPFSHMHELYFESMVNTVQHEVRKKFPRCEECHVHVETITGEPADVICDYAGKNEIGLIVMATHGGSGLKAWMLGSVVDKVVRAVNVPTLLIRAREGRPVEGRRSLVNRILLPLDGSNTSEIAMPYVVELAKRLKASVALFQMVQKVYPAYTTGYEAVDWARVNALEEKQARTYLTEVERGLRQESVPVTHAVTVGTDPAYEILEVGKKVNADLVVMATRGRSPIARWILGSTAEKVLLQGDLPLILVSRPAS